MISLLFELIGDSSLNTLALFAWLVFFFTLLKEALAAIRIVPQRYAIIVERFGKYHATLHSGFHILLPYIDRVVDRIDLKEEAVDVPPQECFTKDEVKVIVDGILYISVVEPVPASYGVTHYKTAAMQLAQTTTRSVIGRMPLDRTFEERAVISNTVVNVLEQAGAAWGIRVHRYEIRNIKPPESVRSAMEKQVRAERERRAILARSEGDKQARISRSEGQKLEIINRSEGEKQRLINEAQGQAAQIKAHADATAASLRQLAEAIATPGGSHAVALRLAEGFLNELTQLARKDRPIILPMELANYKELLEKGMDLSLPQG